MLARLLLIAALALLPGASWAQPVLRPATALEAGAALTVCMDESRRGQYQLSGTAPGTASLYENGWHYATVWQAGITGGGDWVIEVGPDKPPIRIALHGPEYGPAPEYATEPYRRELARYVGMCVGSIYPP